MSASVVGLAYTPVKGTRLCSTERLEIGLAGALGDRRFYVIDERDRMVNGKTLGELSAVVASVSGDMLSLSFPDGRVVSDELRDGPPVLTRFYSRQREDRLVDGPW